MNKRSVLIVFYFYCATTFSAINTIDQGESETYSPSIMIKKNTLKSKKLPEFITINKDITNYIDIRAYGDSGWSWTHESPAMNPEFGLALDQFSPTGEIYRGDINFINWESTIGYTCEQWHAPYIRGRSYAFLADPENINQALERGIENFALSNNHTRDCIENIDTGLNGQLSSLFYLNKIKQNFQSLNFHGISDSTKNKITIINKKIKNNQVKIAFASYYTGRDSCPHSVCAEDEQEIINNFKLIQADLKIMMIHTMNDQSKLIQVAKNFIHNANGDLVFGSGPHKWNPIRVEKKSTGHGIIFDSLGNFLHPSMAPQSKNIIARILLDPMDKKIIQIQAISIRNENDTINPSEISPVAIESELEFIPFEIESESKIFKTMYFNL